MNGGWVIILWTILGIVFLVEHSPIWSYLRKLSQKSPVSLLALLALISASAIHATLKPEPGMSGLEVIMGGILCAEGGTNTVTSVTADQCLAGSMLHCVTTNTALSITPPAGSSYEPWTRYGVHDDIAYVSFEDGFLFSFGGTTYGSAFISSSGTMSFERAKGNPSAREMPDGSNRAFMAPLQGSFGLVPRLGGSVSQWHTTNNTYIVAWSGLLQDRTNAPVSFSTELYPNGDFTYRYALSTNAFTATNMVVGAQANGGGEAYAFAEPDKIVDGLTLHWIGFTPISTNTTSTSDTDDDGITDEDEILVYRTDPTVSDTDGDGISDGDEIAASLDPLIPDTNGDGAPDGVSLGEWLADPLFANETNEANVVLSLEGAVPNHCTAVLQISDLLIPLSGTNSWNLHLEDAVRYAYSLKTTGNPTVKLAASPNTQSPSAGFVLHDPSGLFSGSGAYGGDGWMVFPRLELNPIPETECECLHGTDYRNYSIALDPLDGSEYFTNLVWTAENGTACITNESIATLTLAQGFESAIGNLSLPFPFTRWGSIEASVSIHRCQAYSGTYCFACGLYHTGEGGCGHDAGCAAFLALENECTCAPRFVRVNSDDDNFSGTEDRTESGLPEDEDDLLSFTPLDFIRTCCCYEGARSRVKLTAVSSGLRLWKDGETIGVGEEIPGGSGFAIEATEQSPTLGGFAVSYDIYDVETNLVHSITRRFTAANVQIKPDYDDDGAFTADDAWLKTQERPGEEWLVARREAPYKIKLQNECPSDAVLEVLMTGSTNRPALKTSPEDPAVMTPFTGVATNAPLAVKNSGTTVWLDASGTNATASLEYRIAPSGGGSLVSDLQPIRVVDTFIDERWIKKDTYTTYDFSDSTTNIYWEAWSYEDWSCVDFGVGGSFEVGPNLPIGDYEVYAYFADMVTDNLSYGTLRIVDTDIAEDEYAVQCGTTNWVEVSLDMADSYGPADWRIEPVLEDGARLYASESGGTGSTTFSDSTRVWVSAGDIATNYTVTAYYPECTNAMDTPILYVLSVNLEIYKPKVVDPGEPMIPDADELSKGSVTFVNLDNDDSDSKFDYGGAPADDVVTGGDDELVKIKLKIKTSSLAQGQVKLVATAGAGNIAVWTNDNKASASAYTLGTLLNVPCDFSVEGDSLVKTMWLEGISAHTAPQGTMLKMEYTVSGTPCDDEVALTVVGVDQITWKGKGNSLNDNDTLDADPNRLGGSSPNSMRVFPDARVVSGAVEANPRDKVTAEVMLTVEPPHQIKLYLESYDTDDPTANTSPVDDEALEEDNRGTSPAKAGQFTGESGGVLELVFPENVKTTNCEFQVTMQPGDNFRIVASGDKDFLSGLENKDSTVGATDADKQLICNKDVTGTVAEREVRLPADYTSDALTIWRFLHVEADSMAAPPTTGAEKNTADGNLTSITGNGTVAQRVNLNINLKTGFIPQDNSDNLTAGTGNGRFESGWIKIGSGGSTPGQTQTSGLLGNGDDYVRKDSGIDIPAMVSTTGQSDVCGKVISWGGSVFTLSVSSGILSTNYNGGTLNVAGVTATISTVNTNSGANTVNVTAVPTIPFMLHDDDAASHPYQPNTSLMQASDSTNQNLFAAAYIRPVYDLGSGSKTNSFKRNVENADAVDQLTAGRDSASYLRFWTVYVQSAFQGRIVEDTDPNSEGTHLGRTPNLDSSGALVFVEAIRDCEGNASIPAGLLLRKVTIHETGHEFGLDHENNSVMQQGYPVPSLFAPRHLDDMRSKTNP